MAVSAMHLTPPVAGVIASGQPLTVRLSACRRHRFWQLQRLGVRYWARLQSLLVAGGGKASNGSAGGSNAAGIDAALEAKQSRQ